MNDEHRSSSDEGAPEVEVAPIASASLTAADKAWEIGFAKLVAFKQDQGHTNVPSHWLADPALVRWIRQQCQAHEYGLLYTQQSVRLRDLGWKPEPPKSQSPLSVGSIWDERFTELLAFHEQNGHTRIPKNRPEFKRLHNWAKSQRYYQRKGCLMVAHRVQLDSIGFVWNPTSKD
ncbi:MAG: helicase associated domain-containing protein [Prosthecobacter sp.]